jgi:NADH:ubiquinone reductase (H+-translocating)
MSHHVVIIGAGFGGISTAQGLAGADVRITIVDQRNHHLFQPLLYQLATASLATSDIAWPIRHLFRKRREVTTLLASVIGLDTQDRRVHLDGGETLSYDTLVLATGARHAYFGHDQWEPFAPGLKNLEDAVAIRRRILLAFEHAEREPDPIKRASLLTFVVVGGGPTGVELAGAIAELARQNLPLEYRRINTRDAKVVLIEAGPRVLPAFTEPLSAYALRALNELGVDVRLGVPVSACDGDGVLFGAERIHAKTVLWAAGVQASKAAVWAGLPADRAGRVQVEPDLTAPGHRDIFAIGDTAVINAWAGKPVPGIAPVAKQQGKHVANVIKRRLNGDDQARPFHYRHAGNLATIGRRAAVVDFGWLTLRGWLAWWIWGLAHIYFLIGVRNRLSVAMNWLWIYATRSRNSCLITQGDRDAHSS